MKYSFIFLLFIAQLCNGQFNSKSDFKQFSLYFSDGNLPYNTNDDTAKYVKFKQIPLDLCLKFICNGDSSGLIYNYSSLEAQYDTKGHFDFRAIMKYKILNNIFFIYYRHGNSVLDDISDEISLICFNEKGDKLFEKVLQDDSFFYLSGVTRYQFSRINSNGIIETINYINNIEYDTNDSLIDKSIDCKTIVEYSKYTIETDELKQVDIKKYPGRYLIDDYLRDKANDDYAKTLYKMK